MGSFRFGFVTEKGLRPMGSQTVVENRTGGYILGSSDKTNAMSSFILLDARRTNVLVSPRARGFRANPHALVEYAYDFRKDGRGKTTS